MEPTVAEIAEIVRPYLVEPITGNITLRVVEEKIRHVDNWWRVPLEPKRWPERLFPLYEDMAAIEDKMRDYEKLDVLLSAGEPVNAG